MSQIESALKKLFDNHRILFWYDEKEELRTEYEAVDLAGVEKIQVAGNEFQVKHRVVRAQPDRKFLLYFTQAQPAPTDNWLLDLQLAHRIFHTDQSAMYLQELGLDYHFKELVTEHFEFFRSQERRAKLKELLDVEDGHRAIRYNMLAVVFKVEYVNLEAFIQAHAAALFEEDERPDKEMDRFNLAAFYWREIAAKYNYHAETPGIYDFLLEVFGHNFGPTRRNGIAKESRILLSLWKDNLRYQEAFRSLSNRIAGDLGIQEKLETCELTDLLEEDLFRLIDLRIISELAQWTTAGEISYDRLAGLLKKRENKYWHADFAHYYAGLEHAAALINVVNRLGGARPASFAEGVRTYAEELFYPDYHYRQFILHYRAAGHPKVLGGLAEKVMKVYSNDWLLAFNDRWQAVIDQMDQWPVNSATCQRQFFNQQVKPFIDEGKRLFVIISDALRYEAAWELTRQIQMENRYEGDLSYLFSSMPSYTQLGMAALLPHRELSVKEGSEWILADGLSTQGTSPRAKVLEKNAGIRATAIQAEDLMKMPAKTEGRALTKQYDLIYIYHNRIDKIGDDKTSEEKVFEAVQEEIRFLQDLIKKIAAMNGNNIFITADHGFLFQYQAVEDSDFSVSSFSGQVWKESRRYVIGKELQGDAATRHFTAEQAGLAGEAELLIPKSINRLRVRGAGSRYVHGGASLQEIVVPLLRVSVKRKDTTRQVEVDIIKSMDKITTNILPVSFIQTEPVSEKVLPREIRAAFYAEDGTILSDLFQYTFDLAEGADRQRAVKHYFHLSSTAGKKYKNQRVKLVLEQPVEDSNQWKEYKTFTYTLNISFTSDFDDF